MFTGIIEALGKVKSVRKNTGNCELVISSSISHGLKIDQSLSHSGVCLTVEEVKNNTHRVTAIGETLKKTSLGRLKAGDEINLERCMKMNARLDGHLVQGHVDQVGECIETEKQKGSWIFQFRYTPSRENLVVEKGSICVNGISLTAFQAKKNTFSVAIIPYTYEHTNMRLVTKGSYVNLEFDIIGKYVARILEFKD